MVTQIGKTCLVDQVTRLLDQSQHLAEISAPSIQDLIRVTPRRKVDDASWSIDLCPYDFVGDQPTEGSLGFGRAKVQQLRQARQGYLGIVAGDHSDVLSKVDVLVNSSAKAVKGNVRVQ